MAGSDICGGYVIVIIDIIKLFVLTNSVFADMRILKCEESAGTVCKRFGISRRTLYNYMADCRKRA
jgi:hypothetical protein